jgi:hypothetical protein
MPYLLDIIARVERLVGDPIGSPWFLVKFIPWGGLACMIMVVIGTALEVAG